MMDKIKIKVSSFVANILENDALRFGFMKNGKSNKNALLNKLIPTLVEVRKVRRNEIEDILKNEYNRDDSENIYNKKEKLKLSVAKMLRIVLFFLIERLK